MKLWIYIVRRAILLLPVIIGVMTITFVVVSQLGVQNRLVSTFGENKFGYSSTVACSVLYGPNATGQCSNPAYTNAIDKLGLNQPYPVQWLHYMYNSLTLQWGYVAAKGPVAGVIGQQSLPVAQVLGWYLPYTLELAAISLTLILLIAIPIGNYSAVYRNRPVDQGARVLSFSGFALPGFILAVFVLLGATILGGGFSAQCSHTSFPYYQFFGSWPQATQPLCWPGGTGQPSWIGPELQTTPTGFPTVDAIVHGAWWLAGDSIFRMILPAAVIAFGAVASILRFVRNSMLEVLNLDFVRTARAKGVSESRVVSRHAGRNSLNVTVTVLGLTFAGFIGGFQIIEEVFGLKGIGYMLAVSIQPPYDYGMIFGSTLLFTIIVVCANIIVDILYAYLDPRVRLG